MADFGSLTDEELATLVQGNNHEAFGVLVDRYQGKLLRYGRRFLAGTDYVDDAVQDVFIKAYENIRSFDTSRKFSPWVYRIAHNAFLNIVRNRQREPLQFLDLDTLVAHPAYEYDPAEEEERREMQRLLQDGLETLPPRYKEVMILYYLEGQGYQDISDILHVPIGTVGVRLRRAREALKKHVSQHRK